MGRSYTWVDFLLVDLFILKDDKGSYCVHEGPLFSEMPGLRKRKWANVVSYGAAISACAGSAKWELALHLLELLGEQQLKPTITTCNAAMTACEKAGQWCCALHFLGDLQGWRLREDDVSYGAVISACAAGSEWEVAQALLGTMQSRRIRASIITRNAAISACEKAGAWQQAFRLLQSTEDGGPKEYGSIRISQTLISVFKNLPFHLDLALRRLLICDRTVGIMSGRIPCSSHRILLQSTPNPGLVFKPPT